jgi:hypothetical protein
VLEIVFPEAFIHSPIGVLVNSIAVGFVLFPLAFKNIAIDVPEFALTLRSVVLPDSFIFSTVWPHLSPIPLFLISLPLAYILGSIFEKNFGPFF